MILFENVWNKMHYDHDAPPEQSPSGSSTFVDSFNSPWVGMYYDIGNHWKYGQPGEWISRLRPPRVKLDIKGFSRAKNKFVDISEKRPALGRGAARRWRRSASPAGPRPKSAAAGLERLTKVRRQMVEAFGL